MVNSHETSANEFLVSAPINNYSLYNDAYEMYVCLLIIAFRGYLVS